MPWQVAISGYLMMLFHIKKTPPIFAGARSRTQVFAPGPSLWVEWYLLPCFPSVNINVKTQLFGQSAWGCCFPFLQHGGEDILLNANLFTGGDGVKACCTRQLMEKRILSLSSSFVNLGFETFFRDFQLWASKSKKKSQGRKNNEKKKKTKEKILHATSV